MLRLPTVVWGWLVSCSIVAMATSSAAIVIRHDRDEAAYRERGEQFPAVVRIHPAETGTLVHPRFVLTAAHVADGIARDNAPKVDIGRLQYRVLRIYLHPQWSGRGAHDIALLELDAEVRDTRPVRLFRQDDEKGQQILFVGYGDTGTGLTGPEIQDGVVRAATNRVDRGTDEWLYFTFNEPGDGATDWEGVSGPGDSGGPALLQQGNDLLVLGVSAYSFNGKPGRYGTQEAYTRVSTHAAWLDEVLDGSRFEEGFIPGRRSRQGGAASPGGKSVTRGAPSGKKLDDVERGYIVQAWINTYNRRDNGAMTAFIDGQYSEGYRQRKSLEDMLAWIGRMQEQHFGNLTAGGVVEDAAGKLIVRIEGDNGRQGELHVRFDAEGRIDDLMAAIIEAGP